MTYRLVGLVMWLVAAVASSNATGLACAQATSASESALGREILDTLNRNFQSFSHSTNLKINYNLTYELKAGSPTFAFRRLNALHLMNGVKARTEIFADMFINEGEPETLHRIFTWNDRFAMSQSGSQEILINISETSSNLLHLYRYLLEFLGYPNGPDQVGSPDSKIPTFAKNLLPDCLYHAEYKISRDVVMLDDTNCHVFDRNGRNRVWVSVAPEHDIIGREISQPNGDNPLEFYSYKNYRSFGSFRLPTRIEKQEYGRLDQGIKLAGQVCGIKIISDLRINFDSIEDSQFQIAIPTQAFVSDSVRNKTYRAINSETDVLNKTFTEARDGLKSGSTLRGGVLILIAAGLMVAIGYLFRRKRPL